MTPVPAFETSNEIVLPDNSRFYYTINPFEMTNALGNVVAILQEYVITRINGGNEENSYRLYKTKEGNWYEVGTSGPSHEHNVLRHLKTALDMQLG